MIDRLIQKYLQICMLDENKCKMVDALVIIFIGISIALFLQKAEMWFN